MTSVVLILQRVLHIKQTDQSRKVEAVPKAPSEPPCPQPKVIPPIPYRDAEPWFEQPYGG